MCRASPASAALSLAMVFCSSGEKMFQYPFMRTCPLLRWNVLHKPFTTRLMTRESRINFTLRVLINLCSADMGAINLPLFARRFNQWWQPTHMCTEYSVQDSLVCHAKELLQTLSKNWSMGLLASMLLCARRVTSPRQAFFPTHTMPQVTHARTGNVFWGLAISSHVVLEVHCWHCACARDMVLIFETVYETGLFKVPNKFDLV